MQTSCFASAAQEKGKLGPNVAEKWRGCGLRVFCVPRLVLGLFLDDFRCDRGASRQHLLCCVANAQDVGSERGPRGSVKGSHGRNITHDERSSSKSMRS